MTMQIELASTEATRGEFAHHYAPGELDLNEDRVQLTEPPMISGRIRRDGQKLRVEGEVSAKARVECDRCLQPEELSLKADFDLEYVTNQQYNQLQAVELSEEDLNLSVYDGEVVDIDEIAREQLLLAVPNQVLCREDCKGICPKCGTNRNVTDCNCQEQEIDPRWEALKNLKR